MSNQRYTSVLDLQGLTYYHSKIVEMIGGQQNLTEIRNQILSNKVQLDALDLKINNLSAADINAVPTSRKINNKALTADISLTAADIGALASGATATAASKVTSNLTIKLNSGTTEGTNLFTFNGSSAKTINITPENIAALPIAGGTINGNITPGANDTYSLGSSSLKWKNIYATTFTGALSGNASSATTLSSTLPVNKGGTGATTAKAALQNLGVYYQSSQPSLVEGRIWLKPV